MSKRNIAYIKPDEPSFLKKLKQQAGYQEGPTVDTKREDYGNINEDDLQDTEEELPTVVVLKKGDLTADEAAQEKSKLEREAEETPADLTVPIVFKPPTKPKTKDDQLKSSKSKKSKTLPSLSFDEEEYDD